METLSPACIPVPAKHSKSFSLIDCISVDVNRGFVEGKLEVPSTWREPCTISTSNRNTSNFGRGRSGVCRTHSHPHLGNWSRFRNLRRRRNWESFWRLGFRSRTSRRVAAPMPYMGFQTVSWLLEGAPLTTVDSLNTGFSAKSCRRV